MLPFAARGRFNLDPGELSIQPVKHAEDERDDKASGEMARGKTHGPERPEQKPEHSDLIRGNGCPAELGNDERFDRRMHVCRNVQRAILGRVENDGVDLVARLGRCRQAEWPDVSAHARDVAGKCRGIEGLDRSGCDRALERIGQCLVRRTALQKRLCEMRGSTER